MKKKKMERGIRNPKDYYTRLNLFRTSKRKKKKKKKKKHRKVEYVKLNSGSSKSRGVF